MRATFKSLGAIMAGFLTTAVLMIACYFLISEVAPSVASGEPGSAYLAVTLVAVLCAALAGGLVIAVLAPRAPLAHALVLSLILTVFNLFQSRENEPKPHWFAWLTLGLGVVGLPLGAWLWSLNQSRRAN